MSTDYYEVRHPTVRLAALVFPALAIVIPTTLNIQSKLTMPVLAIGASGSLGASEAIKVREYATNVTEAVIPDSGHWIYEEQPAYTTKVLLDFLDNGRSS